jgi:hypothetical protein
MANTTQLGSVIAPGLAWLLRFQKTALRCPSLLRSSGQGTLQRCHRQIIGMEFAASV